MGHQPVSMNPNTTSKSSTRSSSGYHLKALAEIRNSLLPFANSGENVGSSAASTISTLSTTSGISSASGLSGLSASSGCIDKEQLNAMGYIEESNHRPLKKFDPGTSIELLAKQSEATNGLSKSSSACLPSLNTKLIRKPSLERELCLHRGSPALDSGAGSSRSDSPHTQLSRQYSPSSFSEPPPPPPPRCSSTPPPPPPPHAPYSNAITNMQHLLKRMSPAPVVSSRPPAALPGSAGSGPNPPQRGTSPVASSAGPTACSGRQPMVVQNGPQVQQQLTQQMQALSLYQSPAPVEPPPPYPLGSSSPGPLPPPSYSASIQSRQSPTQDYRKSPSSGIYSNPNSIGSASPITVSAPVTPTSSTVGVTRPTPLQAWGARQAKTQPPFIMQSVKSTQVQKPILQTAIAPTAPQPAPHGVAIPPPSYASSIQQKQQTQMPSFTIAPGKQVANVGSSSPKQPPASPVTTTASPISVPTTEPPSYASTMQALAMQKGMVTPSTQHIHHPMPPPPYAGDDACRSGSSPGVLNVPQVTTLDGSSPRSSVTSHPSLQRKFSPIMPGESRSDSPLSVSSSESGRTPLAAYPSVNAENTIGVPTTTQVPPTITTKTSSKISNNNSNHNVVNNSNSNNNNNNNSNNNISNNTSNDNNNNNNVNDNDSNNSHNSNSNNNNNFNNSGNNNSGNTAGTTASTVNDTSNGGNSNFINSCNSNGNSNSNNINNNNNSSSSSNDNNNNNNSNTNNNNNNNYNYNNNNYNNSNNNNNNNNHNNINSAHNNSNIINNTLNNNNIIIINAHNNSNINNAHINHNNINNAHNNNSNNNFTTSNNSGNNIDSDNDNDNDNDNDDDDDDDDDDDNNNSNDNHNSNNNNSSSNDNVNVNDYDNNDNNNNNNNNDNNNNHNNHNNNNNNNNNNNSNNNINNDNNNNNSNNNNDNINNNNSTSSNSNSNNNNSNSNSNSNNDNDICNSNNDNNNNNNNNDNDNDNNNNDDNNDDNNNNGNSNSNNNNNNIINNSSSNSYNNLNSNTTGMQNGNSNGNERRPSPTSAYKVNHQSPIPERKQMSKEKEEERRDCKVRNYSPQAYKFFMEQHVENVIKNYKQRQFRRVQLESEMNKIGLNPECQSQMRKMLSQKESNYIRLKRAKMDKSMFKKMKTIGVGAFGEVALVCKIDANHLYAMKTLRKADVLKRNQVAHVKAERDILAEADNEWVVKLYYSFQDKDNLYFVMDYIPGGDLMSLLIKLGVFQESLARFYIAELTCAIESVHKMGFIHRDIKPDNILIDKDGHIKLTDFGLCTGFRWTHNSKYYQRNGEHARQDSMDPSEDWSNECRCRQLKPLERRRRREHQRCLAHSLVGTPNYIAPEVLLRTGYTQLCDWWSVGVILYEMVVGSPPFLANTPAETQYKVINWEQTLHIPKDANLSPESTDLILKLCCGADKRLGKNASEVKAHLFFKSIDFEKGLRTQPAPYLPRIQNPMDTSNFDPVDPDKLHQSGSSDSTKSDELLDNGNPFHGFFEFTFRRFFDDGGGPAAPFRINLDDNDNPGPVYV